MRSYESRAEVLRLVAEGLNDSEIARRTGVPRTTVRYMRRARSTRRPQRPLCPRCWQPAREVRFTAGDYAQALGLYLGDGYICAAGRTQRLRVSLDRRYPRVVDDTVEVLSRSFPGNVVGRVAADGGATVVVSVYSRHLSCLFPQHGPGKKHERPIALEGWQWDLVLREPWRFLRGCLWSDGCAFVNRTGRYAYPSWEFRNWSTDLLEIFGRVCSAVGVEHRAYAQRVRIYRRASVALIDAHVGRKA